MNQAANNLITSSMLRRTTLPTPTIPPHPRVGGVDSIGSWTGKGARGLGKDPKGPNCRRIFNSPDPLKGYNTWVPVEKACKAGVLDEDLHFSMSSEPNGLRVTLCLAAFEKHIVDCGMDGVFNIIKKDGTTINILQAPGMLAEDDLVPNWIMDLTVLGVWHNGKRLPVCPQDVKNLDMSGEAIYNSSSLEMQENLTTTLTEEEQTGPSMLVAIIFKIQRPSKARTKLLEEKAGTISLRNIPAENVQEYNKLMTPILKDIKSSIMTGQVLPDLTTLALHGLNTSSDPALYNIVSGLCIKFDRDGKPNSTNEDKLQQAIAVLQEVEDAWSVRLLSKHYGPAVTHKAAEIKANLAAALVQQRAAASTTGNGTRPKPKCWDCESETHLRGDPACPHKGGKAAPESASKGKSKFTPRHGLTEAEVAEISVLTKAEDAKCAEGTYPPDGAQVTKDGKVVATRCAKCKKWTKGKSMHNGDTHGKQSAASGGAPAVPPVVPAQLASVAELQAQLVQINAQLAAQPAGMLCCLPTSAPASAPADIPQYLMAANPPDYSLGRMSTAASGFLGAVPCLPTSMSPVVSFKGAPHGVPKGAPKAVHKGATRETLSYATLRDEAETDLQLTASAELVLEQMLIQSADSEDSGTDDHDGLMALLGNYNFNLNF